MSELPDLLLCKIPRIQKVSRSQFSGILIWDVRPCSQSEQGPFMLVTHTVPRSLRGSSTKLHEGSTYTDAVHTVDTCTLGGESAVLTGCSNHLGLSQIPSPPAWNQRAMSHHSGNYLPKQIMLAIGIWTLKCHSWTHLLSFISNVVCACTNDSESRIWTWEQLGLTHGTR